LTHISCAGVFDGHGGNLASKFAASKLFNNMTDCFSEVTAEQSQDVSINYHAIEDCVTQSFENVHHALLGVIASSKRKHMSDSGTTATIMTISRDVALVASLGDSRAVLSVRSAKGIASGLQITNDHTAANVSERELIESRGGFIVSRNGVSRVNEKLVVTRSIGDAPLSHVLSQQPEVFLFRNSELLEMCGRVESDEPTYPCFVILASDGLWDSVSNTEAVSVDAMWT
jgi:protein phosphatase 1L